MSEPVLITLITVIGGLITAVVVEMIRRQRNTDRKVDTVLGQISPNSGSSMHDAVTRIERDVRDVKDTQRQHGERLAAVEARVADHLARS